MVLSTSITLLSGPVYPSVCMYKRMLYYDRENRSGLFYALSTCYGLFNIKIGFICKCLIIIIPIFSTFHYNNLLIELFSFVYNDFTGQHQFLVPRNKTPEINYFCKKKVFLSKKKI